MEQNIISLKNAIVNIELSTEKFFMTATIHTEQKLTFRMKTFCYYFVRIYIYIYSKVLCELVRLLNNVLCMQTPKLLFSLVVKFCKILAYI